MVAWSGELNLEDSEGMIVAFERLMRGIGVKRNEADAKRILFDASLLKNPIAIAVCILNKIEFPRNEKSLKLAVSLLRNVQENPSASFYLAQFHASGLGFEINAEESIQLATAAASQGHVSAIIFLADAFERGYGVSQNLKEALKNCNRAAELGHIEAKFKLGMMYRDGIGVDRNVEKAVEFLRSAAELGHIEAHKRLPILAAVEKSESSGTLDLSALDAVVCNQVLQRVDASKIKRVLISNSPMSELPPSFDRLREITVLEISDSSIPLRDSLCALKLERLVIRGLRAIVMALLFV